MEMCGNVEILTISEITGNFQVQIGGEVFEELTYSHGKNLISGCVGLSCAGSKKGPMFILLIFWAVAGRTFEIFVFTLVRRRFITRKVCSILNAIVDLFLLGSDQINQP